MHAYDHWEPDNNLVLRDIQHDCYFDGLRSTLRSMCQKRYFAALSLLSTSSALAVRFEQQDGFDHRVLYAAHDYIAAYYRFSIGDCSLQTLFESEAQWRDRLKADWISFYESEVSRLAHKDEFCVAVLTASAFQNLPEGRAAEGHLDTLLFLEYGEFTFERWCHIHTKTPRTKEA
jgi:hypothetical protein